MPVRIPRLFLFMVAFVASADADDRPSWAVSNAADRLIAKNALFMPGGDGFLKQPSGQLVQYERPSKSYARNGKNWMIEILSPRWRKQAGKEWQPWNDARPQYDHWKIGVIRVDVLISGVEAHWVDSTNFSGRTPPTQAEVTHQLDSPGQASPRTRDNQVPRTNQGPASEIRPHRGRSEQPSHGGIYKKLPDGTLQKVAPQQIPEAPLPDSNQPLTSPRTRVVPPPSPPQISIPPPPSNVARFPLPESEIGWVIPLIALALVAIVATSICLLGMRRKTTTPSHAHSTSASLPPASPITSPVPGSNQTTSQPDHLTSPAESSFLNALQRALGPSYTIAAKVRATNLFGADATPEVSHDPFGETLIDFVIYHPSESRILCAIELDENSRSRPDHLKRDSFLTELFESNQVPLLRIPISWGYFPQGIRAELQKAGMTDRA